LTFFLGSLNGSFPFLLPARARFPGMGAGPLDKPGKRNQRSEKKSMRAHPLN
jgi:hypothetical protein